MRDRENHEMVFLSRQKDGRVLLRVYVQPRASRNGFGGVHGDSLKLAITTPPVDGKANLAVIDFVASFLGVKKADLVIKHGLQSRKKSILIANVSFAEIARRLKSLYS